MGEGKLDRWDGVLAKHAEVRGADVPISVIYCNAGNCVNPNISFLFYGRIYFENEVDFYKLDPYYIKRLIILKNEDRHLAYSVRDYTKNFTKFKTLFTLTLPSPQGRGSPEPNKVRHYLQPLTLPSPIGRGSPEPNKVRHYLQLLTLPSPQGRGKTGSMGLCLCKAHQRGCFPYAKTIRNR